LYNYGKQTIEQDDIDAVVSVMKSDRLTQGPVVEYFEEALAEYVGAKYAVAFNSGSSALHAALHGFNKLSKGVTTCNTFKATHNAIEGNGYELKLLDINLNTYNAKYKESDDVIQVPVHFAGLPAKFEPGQVVEDACHALGARYEDGSMVGCCKDSMMTCFSFHPVKTITTGEGGAVTTNSQYDYEILKRNVNHGMGQNYRMTDIQAALGLSQLKKINRFLKRRREIFKIYNSEFKDIFKTPAYSDNSACHIYVGWFENKRVIAGRLLQAGIKCQEHYFNDVDYFGLPNYEKYKLHNLTLPLYPGLTDKEIEYIIRAVKECV